MSFRGGRGGGRGRGGFRGRGGGRGGRGGYNNYDQGPPDHVMGEYDAFLAAASLSTPLQRLESIYIRVRESWCARTQMKRYLISMLPCILKISLRLEKLMTYLDQLKTMYPLLNIVAQNLVSLKGGWAYTEQLR